MLELQPNAETPPPAVPPRQTGTPGQGRPARARHRPRRENGAEQALGPWLNGLLLLVAVVLGLAWTQKDRLPPPQELLPDLAQAPAQTPVEDAPFRFGYRKHEYEVKTLAAYELWGVIVSHNDITGLADIYHSADSFDTKDVCVLWGGNAGRDDYLKARFSSGAWTCYYEYPEGVSLNPQEVSNNHLITTSASLRKAINGLHKGDQIHFRGRLVSYRDLKAPEFWRTSSLTRSDSGNGACEVVLVEQLDVLKPGNPGWRKTYQLAAWAFLALLALRGLLFLRYLFQPADERLTGFTYTR